MVNCLLNKTFIFFSFFNLSMSSNLIKTIYRSSTLVPWMKQNALPNLEIVKASGHHIYTQDQKITDFTCGAMVVSLGHRNKYVQGGLSDHTDTGIAYVPSNFATHHRDYLSDRLIDVSEFSNGKVLYGNGGADANEMACFLAQEYQNFNQRTGHRVLSFEKSFHGGSTIGASLISGDARRVAKDKYYQLPWEPILPNADWEDQGKSSLEAIDKMLDDSVSSILVEGSSGSAGCILYPEGYLSELAKLCQDKNILFICDEVMSGFGRTGSFWAHQKQDVKPDIITCAKALTSGYSQLSGVILNSEVSSVFQENPVMCGLTYSGHPLSCTVANRCMDLYLQDNRKLLDNVNEKSNLINQIGCEIAKKYSFIREYRNNGFLGCFELDLSEDKLAEVSNLLIQNNIYCMRIRHNIFTSPMLGIDDDLLGNSMKQIETAFSMLEI